MLHRSFGRNIAALLSLAAIGNASCKSSSVTTPDAGKGKPDVLVVNYPLKYFAERIGGARIAVRFPVPADIDPAYWNPDGETVSRFQNADVILLNGAGYAGWIKRASLPDTKLVDTSHSVAGQLIPFGDSVTHQHGPSGEHTHDGFAFTTWLDPLIAIEQARAVYLALQELLPEHKFEFEQRFADLERELNDLDRQFNDIVAGKQDQPLIASHPVYQYLARRYKLNVKSLHWEPDQTPHENEWQELDRLLAKHPAKWMLWEAKPTEETAKKLKALGVEVIVFAPLGNQPAKGDFMELMRDNADGLSRVFASQTP